MAKVAEIEEAEKNKMKSKCVKIIDHGINCFINRQLIYNFPEQIFTDAGVVSIEHADFDGIERLAAVTGGEIASTFDRPDLVALGECDLIDEIIVGKWRIVWVFCCDVDCRINKCEKILTALKFRLASNLIGGEGVVFYFS
jgi:T-complex protein 1 subunit beta